MINKQETKKGFQPKKEKNRMLEKGYKGKNEPPEWAVLKEINTSPACPFAAAYLR